MINNNLMQYFENSKLMQTFHEEPNIKLSNKDSFSTFDFLFTPEWFFTDSFASS
jgi:hypothetical protein